jgi:hypothetical protein
MQEFLVKMELIAHQPPSLQSMRSAARRRVIADFNLKTNLARTASHFLSLIGKTEPHKALRDEPSHAHPVLQQI